MSGDGERSHLLSGKCGECAECGDCGEGGSRTLSFPPHPATTYTAPLRGTNPGSLTKRAVRRFYAERGEGREG